MKLSFTTIILFILVLIVSVFVANITNLIAVQVENSYLAPEFEGTVLQEDGQNNEYEEGTAHAAGHLLNDQHNSLMWFIQISDIHVSIFHEASRIMEFQEFCELTVETIMPSVVLATGDLTDAKTADNMGSAQQLEEWHIYWTIVHSSRVLNKTVWLDLRGNHDNFNIPGSDSSLNYYREFTVQGAEHPHSYLYTVSIKGRRYGFLAIDACLSPGPKRPFNFVGVLNHSEADHVKYLISQAKRLNVDYTISFGHYPTSCIISPSKSSVRGLITSAPGALVYLCGHFHTLGGLVPNMYTLQKSGFLELELGDWKDNRLYRLAAMDNGLFSFTDVVHGRWPVILITNPKHALYHVPFRESKDAILTSTHVRVLAFSLSPITLVQVQLDGGAWHNASNSGGPLYTLRWEPSVYKHGVHTVAVRVRDEMDREFGIEQPFTLDRTRLDFRFWPRLLLMTNISVVFQALFGLALCMCTVPLCALRVAHVMVCRQKLSPPRINNRFLLGWVRSVWILSSVNRIFYPLVLYALYLSVGPWAVGEVIDGYIGAVFAWGLVVNKSYLPGSFTYAYGFMQIVGFQIPITLILASALDKRYRQLQAVQSMSHLALLCDHLPFAVLITIQMLFAYFFWLAYGTMAFFIGPLRTWSVVLALILWRLCTTLPPACFREVCQVWDRRHPPTTDIDLLNYDHASRIQSSNL